MAMVYFQKELRALWNKIKGRNAPYPEMAQDIEECLRHEEWGVALEHILDWAAHEKKLHLIQSRAEDLKQKMKDLKSAEKK